MYTYNEFNYDIKDEDMMIYKHPLPTFVEKHTHSFLELVYVSSGSGYHIINNVKYPANHGDLFFIGIGQTHEILNDEETMEVIDCSINPNFVEVMFENLEDPLDILAISSYGDKNKNKFEKIISKISFRGKDLFSIERILEEISTEYSNKDSNYKSIVRSYLFILLNYIFREMRDGQHSKTIKHINKITPEIISFINNNISEKLTLNSLAKKTFYSPTYFSRIFKQCYGISLIDYINEKRLEKAVDLLCKSNTNIQEIGNASGFYDNKYFYKLFKKKYGVTPKEMRNNIQNY